MAVLTHMHTYTRVKGKPDLYQCKNPHCMHYINKKLIVGKMSKCICGNEFVLTTNSLKLKDPHCVGCIVARKSPNPKARPRVEAELGNLENILADVL